MGGIFPALRVFFPFVRTGHNVANYTASYVPVLAQAMEKLDKGFEIDKLPPTSRPLFVAVSVSVQVLLLLLA